MTQWKFPKLLEIISNKNSDQIEILMNKMNKTIGNFQGIDKEINDNYFTYNMLKEKTKKYLEIIKKYSIILTTMMEIIKIILSYVNIIKENQIIWMKY